MQAANQIWNQNRDSQPEVITKKKKKKKCHFPGILEKMKKLEFSTGDIKQILCKYQGQMAPSKLEVLDLISEWHF